MTKTIAVTDCSKCDFSIGSKSACNLGSVQKLYIEEGKDGVIGSSDCRLKHAKGHDSYRPSTVVVTVSE